MSPHLSIQHPRGAFAGLYQHWMGRGAGFRDFLRLPSAKENRSNRRTLPTSSHKVELSNRGEVRKPGPANEAGLFLAVLSVGNHLARLIFQDCIDGFAFSMQRALRSGHAGKSAAGGKLCCWRPRSPSYLTVLLKSS